MCVLLCFLRSLLVVKIFPQFFSEQLNVLPRKDILLKPKKRQALLPVWILLWALSLYSVLKAERH